MRKSWVILIILILTSIGLVSALTQGTGVDLNNQQSVSDGNQRGWTIHTHTNMTLYNITKSPLTIPAPAGQPYNNPNQSIYASIHDASGNLLAESEFIGDVAIMNYPLQERTDYIIAVGTFGDHVYLEADNYLQSTTHFPYNNPYFSIVNTAFYSGGVWGTTTDTLINIESIDFEVPVVSCSLMCTESCSPCGGGCTATVLGAMFFVGYKK